MPSNIISDTAKLDLFGILLSEVESFVYSRMTGDVFISLNSAFPEYSRCYFLIMGSETKSFLYTRCAFGTRSVEICGINVFQSKTFRYGKFLI